MTCGFRPGGAQNRQTGFAYPTPETTLTIPSAASGAISVGAYDSRSREYAPFSGRGFTWERRQVKPDLVAPGVDITSCAPGGGYAVRSGTSMASPFVTGSAALLMEWGIVRGNDPYLYGQKMKAYLLGGTTESARGRGWRAGRRCPRKRSAGERSAPMLLCPDKRRCTKGRVPSSREPVFHLKISRNVLKIGYRNAIMSLVIQTSGLSTTESRKAERQTRGKEI